MDARDINWTKRWKFALAEGKNNLWGANQGKEWSYIAKEYASISVFIPEGFIVIDLDEERVVKIFENWVRKNNGAPFPYQKTTKGYHLLFKNNQILSFKKIKNNNNQMLLSGLRADIKNGGHNGSIHIKLDGNWREWYFPNNIKNLNDIPDIGQYWYFVPFNFKEEIDSILINDNRYNTLAKIALSKYKFIGTYSINHDKFFVNSLFLEVLKFVNEYVFLEKTSQENWDKIVKLNNGVEQNNKELCKEFEIEKTNQNGEFLGCIFNERLYVDYFLDNHTTYLHENEYWFYHDEEKRFTNREIEALGMIYKDTTLPTSAKIENALKMVKMNIDNIAEVKMESWKINLNNGIYDFKNHQLIEHDDYYFIKNKVFIDYDPTIDSFPIIDQIMNDYANGIQERVDTLWEMIAYSLWPNSSLKKLFIIYKEGNNGKSTFLKFISKMIGYQNVSHLDLEKIKSRWGGDEVSDKLVNICEEMPENVWEDMTILKALSSGDEMLAEKKGKNYRKTSTYATFWFSCNILPNMKNKDEAFLNRLIIFPFDKKFETSTKFDIEDLIFTNNKEERKARSYFFNKVIEGSKRLQQNSKFSAQEMLDRERDNFAALTNSVIEWINDSGIIFNEEYFATYSANDIWSQYKNFCEENKLYLLKKDMITRAFKTKFNKIKVRRRFSNRNTYFFVDKDKENKMKEIE